jgi:hypothetical protein
MSDTEPKRILVGGFPDGMPTRLFVPRDGLRLAGKILDAERQKRERFASHAKMEASEARGIRPS